MARSHRHLKNNQILQEGTQIMLNTENSSTPESTGDTLKWIGKLILTVAAGIILSRYGVRIPDNVKI
jgi:hypothetical protein